jgi:hypothetical protein
MLRVVARNDLAFRLVIEDHPRQAVGEAQLHELAIDLDPVARTDRLPDCAGSPLTLMRPAAISSSISRREPMPLLASSLCRRSGLPAGSW